MRRFGTWLSQRFSQRPGWMNALMVFAAFQVFVYSPWDLLAKPLATDEDVWLGVVLTGWPAKFGGLAHLVVYAVGLFGFWRMRPWMWPWAAFYVWQMAFAMLVWPVAYVGGARGWVMGIASGAAFAVLGAALWKARTLFRPPVASFARRYGEWAVVTGASAGIGLEFARALAARGMSIVLVARRADRLERLAAELASTHGVETKVVAVDLSGEEGADRLADAVAELEVGMLVSNAGVGYAGRLDKQDLSRLRRMVTLNCTAHVTLLGRFLPGMLGRRRGAMILVGSVAGRQPLPLHAVYSATKGFELLLGEALWAEMQGRGVDVLVVQPGPVATEFEQVAGEQRDQRPRQEAARRRADGEADASAHALRRGAAGVAPRPATSRGRIRSYRDLVAGPPRVRAGRGRTCRRGPSSARGSTAGDAAPGRRAGPRAGRGGSAARPPAARPPPSRARRRPCRRSASTRPRRRTRRRPSRPR